MVNVSGPIEKVLKVEPMPRMTMSEIRKEIEEVTKKATVETWLRLL